MTSQRITLTKRLLREALFTCLQNKPIQKITIVELCEQAQINRSTFYAHYQTSRDILVEMGWQYANIMKQTFHENKALPLQKRLALWFSFLNQHRDDIKIVFQSQADYDIATSMAQIFTFIYDEIVTDKPDPYEYDLTVTAYGYGAYHMVRKWIIEDIPKTPQELASLLLQMTHSR